MDLLFLANALQRRYPSVVTRGMADTWRAQPQRMAPTDPLFAAANPATAAAALGGRGAMGGGAFGSFRGGGGFGGGSSFGGGGRGGGW